MNRNFMQTLFSLLAVILLGHCNAYTTLSNKVSDVAVQITGVKVTPETLQRHHTDLFKHETGFSLRRGIDFDLIVETTEPLGEESVVMMAENIQSLGKGTVPKFITVGMVPVKGKTNQYKVTFNTKIICPIGRFDDIVFYLAAEGPLQVDLYFYPFIINLLFNPWHPKSSFYSPDDEFLNEYVLTQEGVVYTGTSRTVEGQPWWYGHMDGADLALEAVFYMLSTMPEDKRGDDMQIVQHISHNIGMVNQSDTQPPIAFRGRADGVLNGRWAKSFPGGEQPERWNNTIELIKLWKFNNKTPVKYGQCWVFAAIQNTYLRALGIPARQTSGMGAMIPAAGKLFPDNKDHHVIYYYYNKDAKLVYKEGHVWNFHSWNELYFHHVSENFAPAKYYPGWSLLDGTPSGSGPGPLKAVKAMDTNVDGAASKAINTVISTVHSLIKEILVENCTEDSVNPDIKPSHCDIVQEIRRNNNGTPLIVTKKPGTFSLQKDGELDVTDLYFNKTVEAYIPVKHNPWAPIAPPADNGMFDLLQQYFENYVYGTQNKNIMNRDMAENDAATAEQQVSDRVPYSFTMNIDQKFTAKDEALTGTITVKVDEYIRGLDLVIKGVSKTYDDRVVDEFFTKKIIIDTLNRGEEKVLPILIPASSADSNFHTEVVVLAMDTETQHAHLEKVVVASR